VTILEGYGLSETSPVASFAKYGEEPRVGSIGRPIAGVQMKLINDDWSDLDDQPGAVGEIAIKGHNAMKGYYKRPEATAEAINDGWFRTGDLARKDADGFYFIVDRSKDMIIRGGFNVYSRELEEVLMEHPAVSLVAVIGVPHPSHGEEIKALVVKKAGDSTTEAELTAWGKEQFAGHKYPHRRVHRRPAHDLHREDPQARIVLEVIRTRIQGFRLRPCRSSPLVLRGELLLRRGGIGPDYQELRQPLGQVEGIAAGHHPVVLAVRHQNRLVNTGQVGRLPQLPCMNGLELSPEGRQRN
jgi:acyl-CoA synthetase (AMP-forming)/AMP-acid ligase II